jgi:ABC-type transport system involved in cytochrome c biogenesis permease subunit
VLELHHNLIEVVLLLLGALAFIAFLPLRRNRLHLFRVFTLFFWLNLLLLGLSLALILKHTGDSLSVELARGLRFLLLLR